MKLKFEKWHGCKNDFIVINVAANDKLTLSSLRNRAQEICSRRGDGIGADGLIILQPANKLDLMPAAMTIINSDGSQAAICGNGIRCAALSNLRAWRERGNPHDKPDNMAFSIAASSGESRQVLCQFLGGLQGRLVDGSWPMVSVDMGDAKVGRDLAWAGTMEGILKFAVDSLSLGSRIESWEICEIGNPHIVIFSESADGELIRTIGPALQKGPTGWDGINVHVVRRESLDNKVKASATQVFGTCSESAYKAWTWERGAGETQACGSGACAIGLAAISSGDAERDGWISVEMPGGRLYVRQDSAEDSILLAGPGQFVFDGTLDF